MGTFPGFYPEMHIYTTTPHEIISIGATNDPFSDHVMGFTLQDMLPHLLTISTIIFVGICWPTLTNFGN